MSGTTELQRKMDYVAELERLVANIGFARNMSDDNELPMLEDLDSAIDAALAAIRHEAERVLDNLEKTSPPGGE